MVELGPQGRFRGSWWDQWPAPALSCPCPEVPLTPPLMRWSCPMVTVFLGFSAASSPAQGPLCGCSRWCLNTPHHQPSLPGLTCLPSEPYTSYRVPPPPCLCPHGPSSDFCISELLAIHLRGTSSRGTSLLPSPSARGSLFQLWGL